MDLRLSPAGFDAVRAFEGFAARSLELPDGGFVIGHGHVEADARAAAISAEEAVELLQRDLAPIEAGVAAALFAPVSQAQFDALVSFAFSIGLTAFRTSPVLTALNAGFPLVAAEAMAAWRYSAARGAPAALDLLIRRRAAEQAMFLALDPPVSAPSAALRPIVPIADAPAASPGPAARRLRADADDRLKAILASRPETAIALSPPPAHPSDRPEQVAPAAKTPTAQTEPVSGSAAAHGDQIALSALAVFGATLLIVGAAGLAAGGPHAAFAFALFGGPGALASLISLYYLARLGS